MKRFFNILAIFILNFFIFSCGSKNGKNKSDFSIQFEGNKSSFHLNESVKGSIINKENKPIDSISYFLGNQTLQSSGKDFNFNLKDSRLGNWPLRAIIYSGEQVDTISKEIKILNDQAPAVYTFEVINEFPHSNTSYTQGLEFHDGQLYESTGQRGRSRLLKVDLESGDILDEIKLDDQFFGEGLTILNNKIFQLTWQSDVGFIYDLQKFEKTGSFGYNQSKEGWGLCNDGEKIYKSDGTEKIWILNSETLAEEDYIQVATNKGIKSKFNELEWVDGKIYANTYQFPSVSIINPQNGAIEAIINFKGLQDRIGNKNDLDPVNEVLNGIAYNSADGKLYVTGKDWDKLFEVRIIKN